MNLNMNYGFEILQRGVDGKILKVKRLPDGKIFKVGIKTHDCTITAFVIDYLGQMLVITDVGNVTKLEDAVKVSVAE